jgi:hypothetical protein
MEQEPAAVARQRRGIHVSTATNQHVTIDVLLEAVFSVWSAPRLYSEDQQQQEVTRVSSMIA